MIPEFFVLVSFFYHFGWVANLIIKRAPQKLSAMIGGAPYFQRVFTYTTIGQAQQILARELTLLTKTERMP